MELNPRCYICDSIATNKGKIVDDRGTIYVLYRCNSCGLYWCSTNSENEINYDQLYDRNYYTSGAEYEQYVQRRLREELPVANATAKRLELLDLKSGNMLDIACGDGFQMKHMKDKGWNVTGIEMSTYAAQKAEKLSGSKVILGDFLQPIKLPAEIHFVQMRHIVEHLTNPIDYITKAYNILQPGGVLKIDTPNQGWLAQYYYLLDMIKHDRRNNYSNNCYDKWFIDLFPPMHVCWFNTKSMNAALRRAGFKDINIQTAFKGQRQHYPSKKENEYVKLNIKGYVEHKMVKTLDILGSFGHRGSVLVAYARKR